MSRLIFNMAAKCDKAGRSENQDNYWVCPDLTHWDAPTGKTVGNDEDVELSDKGALLVVADGMGGMNAGEKASELVIAGVKNRFSNIPDRILSDEEEIKKFIKDTITEADQSVKDYAKANRSAEGLGSTIVLLWILNERAYCGWCGDSRIYRYNPNNELIRLSHDHSYVQGLVDDGKISEEDAFDHPDGNIITRSLGDNGDVANPEIMVYDVCERDVFLLCSDGLCGLLQDKQIEDIVSTNCSSTKDALAALWEAGTKAGWSDNATIDLLYVISGGKHPKGVAVGYPIKKHTDSKKNKLDSKKISNNSVVTSESAAVKFLRPPYLYYILVVAIAVLCLALYQTCSSNGNGEQGNFNFTFEQKDPQAQNQNDENVEQQSNENSETPTQASTSPQNNGNNARQGSNAHQNQSGGQSSQSNSPISNTQQVPNGQNAEQIVSQIQNNGGGHYNNNEHSPSAQHPSEDYLNMYGQIHDEYKKARDAWQLTKERGYRTKETDTPIFHFLNNIKNNVQSLQSDKENFNALDNGKKNEINKFNKLYKEIKVSLSSYTSNRSELYF